MPKKQLPTLDLDTLEAVSGGAVGRAFTLPNLQNINIGQIAGADRQFGEIGKRQQSAHAAGPAGAKSAMRFDDLM